MNELYKNAITVVMYTPGCLAKLHLFRGMQNVKALNSQKQIQRKHTKMQKRKDKKS